MPQYCHICPKCGHTFQQFRSMGQSGAMVPCPDCNELTARDYAAEAGSVRFAEPPDQFSEAAGVHPSQIAEAKQKFPHHEFTPDGRMVFHSQHHKDRCLKDLGFVEYSKYDRLKTAS